MTVHVRHVVHHQAIDQLFVTGSPVHDDMIRRGVICQNGAMRRSRVRTGRLRSSYHLTSPIYVGGVAGVQVGSPVEYALYQEEGTRYMTGTHNLRGGLEDAAR